MDYLQNKTEVAKYMSRLYDKGLTTCSGGNISIITENKVVIITPSQKDKSCISPDDIGIIDITGKNLSPDIKLSMETQMHLEIYKKRKDIKAIIHAHPVFATSYAIAEKEINTAITDESYEILGDIAYSSYEKSGSFDLANKVSEKLVASNIVIMKKHGIVAVGRSLFEAYNRVEVLETVARMNYILKNL